ncbi:MAG: radical SAM protein [bacterium]|nr:radical SAM protein [bacterium]
MTTSADPGRPCACHVFQIESRSFAYDLGQNGVYEVDPLLGALINAQGNTRQMALLCRNHGDEAYARAMRELETVRSEEGAFRTEWPAIETGATPVDQPANTRHLTLSVTEQCNLRCRYCPYTTDLSGDRPHRDLHMSLETVRAALGLLDRPGPDDTPATVSFYGGEPLLRFDLIRQAVAEIRALGDPQPRLVIDTNGVLIDDAVADFVVVEGIELQISLDGPPDIHDRYRVDAAGRASHAAVVAGVERILARDPDATKRMVFASSLAPPFDLMRVVEYFADFPPYRTHGVGPEAMARIRFADLPGGDDAWPGNSGAVIRSRERELQTAAAAYVDSCRQGKRVEAPWPLLQIFDAELIRYHHRARGPLDDPWTPGGCCKPGDRKIFVRADGVLQPCERVDAAFSLGTTDTGPDPAVVTRMKQEFLAAVAPRCAECWAVRLCDLCFIPMASTWTADSSHPGQVPESACEGARRRAAHTLRLHTTLAVAGDGALDFLDDSRII